MKLSSPEPTSEQPTTPVDTPMVQAQPATAVEPGKSPNPTAPPKQNSGGFLSTLVTWGVVILSALAGWYYAPVWRPIVENYLFHAEKGPARPAMRPVPVLSATAKTEKFDIYLDGLGTVTASNTVTVKSRVEGELIAVHISEGQLVEQGELLAEIDPRPFEMQRDQAKGKLTQDEAALKLANVTLSRQKELMRENATTPQVVDQHIAVVNQAEALIQIDKAAYENALLQLEFCRITSPIRGRVGLRLIDRGNIVRANDPSGLMIITELEPISVVFTIPQDDIPRVVQKMNEKKSLTVLAYDRNFKSLLSTGVLAALDNQVDATTGTLRLKAMFENKEQTLFPNQFVNVRLLIDSIDNAVTVPASAVQRGANGQYVYAVNSANKVELRTVTTGPTEAGRILVLSGLQDGEIVVTDGLDKLRPDSEVIFNGSGDSAPGRQAAPKSSPQIPSAGAK
ncbi:efflux RND transporter periplasmic adaptor subunit [Planctomicrobium sp. SH668]|uniref:efflux RND transporter periplasmic adaptor subunit n=1 Tax=Planctomicrobium sp. SH668 TaxID=3448126 RepID=UPI003F5C5244